MSPTIALHRSSAQVPPSQLRSARSIPLLQSENTIDLPSSKLNGEGSREKSNAGLLHPDSMATSPDRPLRLRRADSTPLLTSSTRSYSNLRSNQSANPSSVSLFDATIRKPRHPTEGDVLGRILGWRAETVKTETGSDGKKSGRMESTARIPLSEVFAVGSAANERETMANQVSDTSDLPEDCTS